MHSSHMWRGTRGGALGYGSGSSSFRAGRSAAAHSEAEGCSACSAASAARIASRSASSGSGVISSGITKEGKGRGVAADDRNVGQRLATLAAACAVAAVSTAAAAGSPADLPNWAAPQIATVVAHKLMGAKSVRKFHPNATLTEQALTSLAADLKEQLGST